MFHSETIDIIQNVGFPIFMVIWFVLRTEKVINNNTDVIRKVLEKL